MQIFFDAHDAAAPLDVASPPPDEANTEPVIEQDALEDVVCEEKLLEAFAK
jgi:hypothetical protein